MGPVVFNPDAPPAASRADDLLKIKVTTPVGVVRLGHVIHLDKEIGIGYVLEESTGTRFAISRRFVPALDQLRDGAQVQFTDNGRNAVVELTPLN